MPCVENLWKSNKRPVWNVCPVWKILLHYLLGLLITNIFSLNVENPKIDCRIVENVYKGV